MSARRAMIRKERYERAKLAKRKDANGKMCKAAERGRLEGRASEMLLMMFRSAARERKNKYDR